MPAYDASSKISSFKNESTITIPIEDEKKYLVEFTPNDSDNPKNWSGLKKWSIVFAITLINICTGLAMTVYASIGDTLKRDTGASQLEYISGMTTFMIAVSLLPLILSPMSESFGRRQIYVVTGTLHALLFLPQILVKNIAVIVVMRLLQGACSSVGNTLVGGSIADMFDASDRGLPMAVFSLFAIGTQGVGPSWSGYTQMNLDGVGGFGGWQWALWITFIINCISCIVSILFLKETRGNIIIKHRANSLKKKTGLPYYAPDTAKFNAAGIATSLKRSYQLFVEPIVFALSLWCGFLWGVVYLILAAIPWTFERAYHFNSGQSHLVLISITIGSVIGFLSNFHQQSVYRNRAARSTNNKCAPEVRLYWSCAGGLLFSIGCIIMAWTTTRDVHFTIPCIFGLVTLIWGIYVVYTALFNYLSDCYETYASSAQAATSAFRNFLGAIFPLFSMKMYEGMTAPWASTLIGLLGFALSIIPFLLITNPADGSKIRARSNIASQLAKEEREAERSTFRNIPTLSKV
ncbi:MFS general substrate transporter [Wallemia mellicola]|nr:MFS general substrate transporter [Wallemia mellicola]TIC01793.1 MFS general substrate transporter [Wallemia mellicola]TIC75653.1 MFS general substrate transporter [Wallemia mellicola]